MATRWRILLVLFVALVASDQATKFLAVARLTRAFELEQAKTPAQQLRTFVDAQKLERVRTRPVVIQRDHLRFKYVENPGAAWGMFGGLEDRVRIPFFAAISSFAILFILLFYRRLPEKERLLQVALALVLGGAVGNFIDRLLRGYVIDFIDLHWKGDPRLHWPTFNIADIAICIGVALLASQSLFGRSFRQEAPEELPEGEPRREEAPRWIELDEEPAVQAAEIVVPARPPAPIAVDRDGALVPPAAPAAEEGMMGNRAGGGGRSEQAGPDESPTLSKASGLEE